MKKLLYFLLFIPFLGNSQTKLKLNGGFGYDIISAHLIGQLGLEYERKIDIDKSFSIEFLSYALDYQYAFGDTNSTLLLTKDAYFDGILEGKKDEFRANTNYINTIFSVMRINLGGNYYLTPSFYLSGRVGLNILYKGQYAGYQNDFSTDFTQEELFSGNYTGDARKQFFFTYDIQANKIFFRRIEFGLGTTLSPAHFYAPDSVSDEVFTLHLDALYFFTTNASLKIYFKKFNTKRI